MYTLHQGIEAFGLRMASAKGGNGSHEKAFLVLFDHDGEFSFVLHALPRFTTLTRYRFANIPWGMANIGEERFVVASALVLSQVPKAGSRAPGMRAESGTSSVLALFAVPYEQEPNRWKCNLHPTKERSPAAPWKQDGSKAKRARCGKLLLCGKSVSGGASSFAQPSMKRALPWRVVKAA
jgi:hypothetical protein